jgi:hypothetical protein
MIIIKTVILSFKDHQLAVVSLSKIFTRIASRNGFEGVSISLYFQNNQTKIDLYKYINHKASFMANITDDLQR